ncbi:chemerin-like receptor 1 [Bombina bombina]|uniref:chemerin-like receptor 1 n=1 Tax=Bombina bombina TaxID=8345 RepID=UPI00235AECC7|nr:chemerin-like receptor 1 [Bombina bombina]
MEDFTDLPYTLITHTGVNSTIEDEDEYPYTYYDDKNGISQNHFDIEKIIHIVSAVIYAVAFFLGTIGNGLVIWMTGFRMKKTVNTVWFLNLAIADFIFTFFLPLSIVYTALGFHWPFGTFMCKLNSTITILNLFASIFLLTVISIDRCLAVVHPVWSQNHRTPRLASMISIAVWFLALIASLPYAFFKDTKMIGDKTMCFNNFILTDKHVSAYMSYLAILRHRFLIITRFLIGFFIPFTVIVSCYTIIAFRLHVNHLATSTKPFKIIIAVIILFFVCWFPYHVFSFLELSSQRGHNSYMTNILNIGIPLTSSLAFLNSCVNPFLYVFIGRDFKEKLRVSFLSIFEKAFNEDYAGTEIKSKAKLTSNSQVV